MKLEELKETIKFSLLYRHSNSSAFDNSFNYRSVIGKLGYLDKGSRSDISYITHQCARFVVNPKKEYGEAVCWLVKYLKKTRDKGTIIKPDKSKVLEVYVDVDFAGNWDPKGTEDADTARSRHGYYTCYMGCLLLWILTARRDQLELHREQIQWPQLCLA